MKSPDSTKNLLGKLTHKSVWLNLLVMFVVTIAIVFVTAIGLGIYTRHGQAVAVPNLTHKSMEEAKKLLDENGLRMEIVDTGYVKTLPADCILEQKPLAGKRVKPGHIISIVINAPGVPTKALPDIIDNCSMREAIAKLKAMGFKVGEPRYVEGESDWVYGVTVDGRSKVAGDKIPIDRTIILTVGNGSAVEKDSVAIDAFEHEEPVTIDDDDLSGDFDEDDFEEIP